MNWGGVVWDQGQGHPQPRAELPVAGPKAELKSQRSQHPGRQALRAGGTQRAASSTRSTDVAEAGGRPGRRSHGPTWLLLSAFRSAGVGWAGGTRNISAPSCDFSSILKLFWMNKAPPPSASPLPSPPPQADSSSPEALGHRLGSSLPLPPPPAAGRAALSGGLHSRCPQRDQPCLCVPCPCKTESAGGRPAPGGSAAARGQLVATDSSISRCAGARRPSPAGAAGHTEPDVAAYA